MLNVLRRVINAGVTDHLDEVEARRIRTLNVAALIAVAATFFTTILYAVWINPDALAIAIGLNVGFVTAYSLVIYANARHWLRPAVWLALGFGSVQIVATTFIVGFDQGPAPFFLVIAIAAVLVTPAEDRFIRWFIIVISAIGYGVLAAVDPESPAAISPATETTSRVRQFILMMFFAVGVVSYQRLLAHRAESALAEANQRSESLLLNILPEEIADRLRRGETEIADRVDAVTVMFIDLVGSTRMGEILEPSELVDVLNGVFSSLDVLADNYRLEKIKTIGDAYMVVGGLPQPRPDHAAAVADMALDAAGVLDSVSVPSFGSLELRIGIDTGPVVAGVIGKRKFGYDLWGRTVNTASRMQTTSGVGEIMVTQAVKDQLDDGYALEGPRYVSVKGVERQIPTYLLQGGPRSYSD